MTIVNSGRNRTAEAMVSTFVYFMHGFGTVTTSLSDTDLASAFTSSRFSLANVTRINNVVTYVVFLSPSQGNNTASNVTEIGFFDASTGGNMLARSVASTATWTAFLKDSTKSMLIQMDCTISS